MSTLEDARREFDIDKREKAADAAVKRALDAQARGIGDIAKVARMERRSESWNALESIEGSNMSACAKRYDEMVNKRTVERISTEESPQTKLAHMLLSMHPRVHAQPQRPDIQKKIKR